MDRELRWIGVRIGTQISWFYVLYTMLRQQKQMARRFLRRILCWYFSCISVTGFQTLFQRLNIGIMKLSYEIWVILR